MATCTTPGAQQRDPLTATETAPGARWQGPRPGGSRLGEGGARAPPEARGTWTRTRGPLHGHGLPGVQPRACEGPGEPRSTPHPSATLKPGAFADAPVRAWRARGGAGPHAWSAWGPGAGAPPEARGAGAGAGWEMPPGVRCCTSRGPGEPSTSRRLGSSSRCSPGTAPSPPCVASLPLQRGSRAATGTIHLGPLEPRAVALPEHPLRRRASLRSRYSAGRGRRRT